MARVYYADLSDVEISNFVDDLVDKTISLAYHNADFICEDCLDTINNNLSVISLFTKDDQVYEEIEAEINGILKAKE